MKLNIICSPCIPPMVTATCKLETQYCFLLLEPWAWSNCSCTKEAICCSCGLASSKDYESRD